MKQIPDVVILHRAMDVENAVEGSGDAQKLKWQFVPKIKELVSETIQNVKKRKER